MAMLARKGAHRRAVLKNERRVILAPAAAVGGSGAAVATAAACVVSSRARNNLEDREGFIRGQVRAGLFGARLKSHLRR